MHIPIHTYVNAICEHISVYKLFVVTTIQTREYPFFSVKTFSISYMFLLVDLNVYEFVYQRMRPLTLHKGVSISKCI